MSISHASSQRAALRRVACAIFALGPLAAACTNNTDGGHAIDPTTASSSITSPPESTSSVHDPSPPTSAPATTTTTTTWLPDPDLASDAGRSLNAAWTKWNKVGPEQYRMVLTRPCDCPDDYVGPSLVAYRGTERLMYGYIGGATSLVGTQSEPPPSVVGLFKLVDEALLWADQVEVVYDDQDGHPTWISITWDTSDRNEVPERYSVSYLEPADTESIEHHDIDAVRVLADEADATLAERLAADG